MTRAAMLGGMLCVVGSLVACETTTEPTAVSIEPTGLSSQLRVAPSAGPTVARRPMMGELQGSDEYGALCGGGQGITVTSTGTGTVTHFGQTVMVSTACLSFADLSVIGEFKFSLTAANGDQAGGLVTGFDFTNYGFDLFATISWGTGRFLGAKGELVFPTRSDHTGEWTSGVAGWIRY